jgi:hypothetical protein
VGGLVVVPRVKADRQKCRNSRRGGFKFINVFVYKVRVRELFSLFRKSSKNLIVRWLVKLLFWKARKKEQEYN